jgi:uncharacterized membrane protein
MQAELINLVAASTAFVGLHFAMSHPLRPALARLGTGGFMAVYNLVSLAGLGWMIIAFRAAPPADLGGSGELGWLLATVITLPAMMLWLGSMIQRNPALPMPGAEDTARKPPQGVFRITRHPMMWGFALWAASHIILWWSWRTVIVSLAVGLLALIGAHMQDRKKRVLMGEAWDIWESQTSYWPRLSGVFTMGPAAFIGGTGVWALALFAHRWIAGIDAGVLRWL